MNNHGIQMCVAVDGRTCGRGSRLHTAGSARWAIATVLCLSVLGTRGLAQECCNPADVTGVAGLCIPNGIIDADDIICILQGAVDPASCPCGDLDCDGDIDLVDVDIALCQFAAGGVPFCCENIGLTGACCFLDPVICSQSTPSVCEIMDTGTYLGDDTSCDPDPCNCASAVATTPDVVGIGPRAIQVTPQPAGSSVPVALRLTSSKFDCLSMYIDIDGSLTDTPVLQSPVDWGTVIVVNREIVPSVNMNATDYEVVAEDCSGVTSEPGIGTTFLWGDMDMNESIDFDDILFTLDAFGGDCRITCLSPVCQGRCDAQNKCEVPCDTFDLFPRTPNGMIDFDDILAVLNSFAGQLFPFAEPCEPAVCCIGPPHGRATDMGLHFRVFLLIFAENFGKLGRLTG